MKNAVFLFLLSIGSLSVLAQSTTLHNDHYKAVAIQIDNNEPYTKTLILLHEIYNSTPLPINYTVGKIMALRGSAGADHRLNIVNINSGSAYTRIKASIVSDNGDDAQWILKTCTYNGKKYMAIEVPYRNPQHREGYHFVGWIRSTGESLKAITYELNGVPQNEGLLSNIQNFSPNMTAHQQVDKFLVSGNVGIGTTNPQERLSVNGNIRAKEIKVETANWPDYVFHEDYPLMKLDSLERFINEYGHLPEIPKASEVEENGVELGDMVNKLLKKNEELTLHLIEKNKQLEELVKRVELLEEVSENQKNTNRSDNKPAYENNK